MVTWGVWVAQPVKVTTRVIIVIVFMIVAVEMTGMNLYYKIMFNGQIFCLVARTLCLLGSRKSIVTLYVLPNGQRKMIFLCSGKYQG